MLLKVHHENAETYSRTQIAGEVTILPNIPIPKTHSAATVRVETILPTTTPAQNDKKLPFLYKKPPPHTRSIRPRPNP